MNTILVALADFGELQNNNISSCMLLIPTRPPLDQFVPSMDSFLRTWLEKTIARYSKGITKKPWSVFVLKVTTYSKNNKWLIS